MKGQVGGQDELRPRESGRQRHCGAAGGKFRSPSAWSRRSDCRWRSASQRRASAKSPHDATTARPRCSSVLPLRNTRTSTATGDVRTVPGTCRARRDCHFGCHATANTPPCDGRVPSDAQTPRAKSFRRDSRPSARTTRTSPAASVSQGVSPGCRRGRSSLENRARDGPSTTASTPGATTSWPDRS